MSLYQFNWKLDLFKGRLLFLEGKKEIGQAKITRLLSKSCIVQFKRNRYIAHSEILSNNQIRMYNATNDRQLAVLKFNLWNSSAQLTYKGEQFQLRSSFLGILGTYWTQKNTNPILNFNNQILKGSITASIPDEEKYHLLIITALQSMLLYGLFFFINVNTQVTHGCTFSTKNMAKIPFFLINNTLFIS